MDASVAAWVPSWVRINGRTGGSGYGLPTWAGVVERGDGESYELRSCDHRHRYRVKALSCAVRMAREANGHGQRGAS